MGTAWRRGLAVLLACALAPGAGCAKRGSVGTAPHANRLTVALQQEPASLDPLLLEGPIAYAVSELFYSYLTNYDANGNMIADLAQEVPTPQNGGVSADGASVTFHLRRNVQWQDGVPLTARDVVFTYRAVMNPNNAIPDRYGYDKVANITAPDPYTVTIRLAKPYTPIVPFFFGGDSNYPILPEHVLAKYPSLNNVAFNEHPIGSGPYKLDRWARGDRLELSANPLYFRGQPKIARLVLPFVHDQSTVVNELMTGELDAAFSLDASRIATLRTLAGHRTMVTPIPSFLAMSFNLADPQLRDANVRRAIAMAIDRDTIVRKISHGVYDARTGTRGLFTWAYDPKADDIPYDPQQARRLLRGRRLQLQLALPTGSQILTQLATAIAQTEASIGIEVTLKQYAREVYMANDGPLMQGRYQLEIYNYQAAYDPDASWLLSCSQRRPNGFNHALYCDTSVDSALSRASSVFERTARARDYATVQQALSRDIPYLFIAQVSEIDVLPERLSGYERPLLSPFNSVARWSLKN